MVTSDSTIFNYSSIDKTNFLNQRRLYVNKKTNGSVITLYCSDNSTPFRINIPDDKLLELANNILNHFNQPRS